MLHNSVLSVQLEKCKKKKKKNTEECYHQQSRRPQLFQKQHPPHVSQIAQTAPNHATHHIFIYIETLFFWINILKLSHII